MSDPEAIHVILLVRPLMKLINNIRANAPISGEAGMIDDLVLVS